MLDYERFLYFCIYYLKESSDFSPLEITKGCGTGDKFGKIKLLTVKTWKTKDFEGEMFLTLTHRLPC